MMLLQSKKCCENFAPAFPQISFELFFSYICNGSKLQKIHMRNPLIDEILSRPEAPQLIEEVKKALCLEKEKREHFYQTITDQEKAEFINGEMIMHSPATWQHSQIVGRLNQLIKTYVDVNNLGYVGTEKVMIRFTRNDYEPDLIFFKTEKANQFKPDQLLFPAPDFIVEVLSKSTENRDRGVKFNDYAAHQVPEYWLVDPDAKSVEQYLLQEQSYHLQVKLMSGMIQSEQIQGLKFEVEALFDDQVNLQELQKIIR